MGTTEKKTISKNKRGLGITTKVALILLSTNLIAVMVTGLNSHYSYHKQLLDSIDKHLHSVARQELQIVKHMLDKHQAHISLLAHQLQLEPPSPTSSHNQELLYNHSIIKDKIDIFKEAMQDISEIAILDLKGNVMVSTNPLSQSFHLKQSNLDRLTKGQAGIVKDLTKNKGRGNGWSLLLLMNITTQSGETAILMTKTKLSELANLVDRHIGLGYTEETMLLYSDENNNAIPIVPLKFASTSISEPRINPFADSPISKKMNRYIDYRGKEVLAIFKTVPRTNWALVFKIDTEEALAIIDRQKSYILISLLTATILLFVIAILFARNLTKPLTELTKVASMISDGDLSRRISWSAKDELGVLSNAFNTMADKLIQSNEQLDQRVKEKTRELAIANDKLAAANRDLERTTLEDPLTRIANRRAFDSALYKEWKSNSRSGAPLSLLMVDVDYFKKYNDSLGHQAGDRCLVEVASILSRFAQRDNDVIARFGGEEFVILLPNTAPESCKKIANSIVNVFSEEKLPHPNSDIADYVTVSVGHGTVNSIVAYNGAKEFFEDVDKALYRAKESGRNQAHATEQRQFTLKSIDRRSPLNSR